MDSDSEPLLPEDPLSEDPLPSSNSQTRPRQTSRGSQGHVPPSSPPRRRRNTFTRSSFSQSSGSPRALNAGNITAPALYSNDVHGAYLNDVESSRANSLSSTGGFRDLRSYDPRALPSTRRGSFRRLTTTGDTPVLAQNASPSLAERWVQRQSLLQGQPTTHYGSMAHHSGSTRIDMDILERENEIRGGAPASSHSHVDADDFDSKPSTRRNSDASSLDDVCFPLDVLDNIQGPKNWPDLSVLEEFQKEETERLQQEATREMAAANMRYDQKSETGSVDTHSAQVEFSHPIVTKVDTSAAISQPQPLSQHFANQKINETETLNGRLRPPKINPFDKNNRFNKASNAEFLKTINYPPHIINNNPEHFRFTYFREDLDSTVHSPSISGLLQPDQKFADLFDCKEYSKQQMLRPSTSSLQVPSTSSNTASGTPIRNATPAPSDTKASSIDDEVTPFWLDVLNPTEEEMKVISKTFQIHPLTTEDIFLGETREKVELFKDYYFVCFRSFDIVQERKKKNRRRPHLDEDEANAASASSIKKTIWSQFFGNKPFSSKSSSLRSESSSARKRRRQIEREQYQRKSGEKHIPKNDELEPLNVYIIVFRHAVLTFHFAPTPHPVNVRRRARFLREYLTVSADWIAYALIDDITDAFGPMIESIEDEVNQIEDAILRMHPGNDSSDEDSSDDEDDFEMLASSQKSLLRNRKGSVVDGRSIKSVSSSSTRSTSSNVIEWKKKGDLLKRIGESRKRVMALLRLLGSKVDVIKGFAKRCNEQWEVAPRSEIGMYLGDIQDHIVTMVQSLNHYEKLLARSHSNYLAQINIDMTKVNNDTNDVLGKISILGTVVLPMNIVTGMWGMNVIVPGQDYDGLLWFWGIVFGMFVFAFCSYVYMKRLSGLD
ncbi:CYFA0S09e04214g1_1 [Cyberlindnera fabianii]|uniref:CYFA0S09e04214g1_1 n=1 Tax=Cyberlindnera fabianii TaxID=36022 RepID=A0A061AZ22_CYBFA|nr:Manganese resistance protein MNR2 [Cyberlindnera fabianii]CDR42467.1 CYFA0S09e04214g1_1 [Cyberlindnera fabianii]